jgi:hypothetical protein
MKRLTVFTKHYLMIAMNSFYNVKKEFVGLIPPIKGGIKQSISMEIETVYNQHVEMTYIEACVEFVKEYDYDISRFPHLINKTLQDKIETEAIRVKAIKSNEHPDKGLGQWISNI